MPKSFDDLEEREILALAISLEEEDSRIYRDFTERLKEKNPEIASVLQSMYEAESSHRERLAELYQLRFGAVPGSAGALPYQRASPKEPRSSLRSADNNRRPLEHGYG